ncbi:hypothetical protein PM8797T_03089 [Gimesia maris DSM 8797]|nr:hypothetical protein PM8797T_03089 [Gimesia maris DSM 8797]
MDHFENNLIKIDASSFLRGIPIKIERRIDQLLCRAEMFRFSKEIESVELSVS